MTAPENRACPLPPTSLTSKDTVTARPGSPFALNPEMESASPKTRTAPRRRAHALASRCTHKKGPRSGSGTTGPRKSSGGMFGPSPCFRKAVGGFGR